MAIGAALGALGSVTGGAGIPSATSGASGGTAGSGSNIISVGQPPQNLGNIIAAIAGPSRTGGVPVHAERGLPGISGSISAGFPGDSLGLTGGISISPLIILAVGVGAFFIIRNR